MSSGAPLRPDPDGHHDDLDAVDLEGLELHVPDDPAELDDDRWAYLDELRTRARDDRFEPPPWSSFLWTSRFRRYGFSGPLVVLVLVGVAALGSLMTVLAPQTQPGAERLPLAASPLAPTGDIDGLVPQTTLEINGAPADARALRPAVLVLIPAECGACSATVRNVSQQAREFSLSTVLVGGPDQGAQLARLDRQGSGGTAVRAVDPRGVLAETYAGEGVVLVLVHADGVVGGVLDDADHEQRYESAFVHLPEAGAPTDDPVA